MGLICNYYTAILLIVFAVSGFFYSIKAVIGETVLKPTGFFFGGFFVHSDIYKSLLEIAVTLINLFGNRTTGICQIQKIVFYGYKAALFQK